MTDKLRASRLCPLLAVFALFSSAAVAQGIEPHWYKCEPMVHGSWEAGCVTSGSGYTKTRLTSSHRAVKLKGGFSFEVEKKPAIECDAAGNGEIWNPASGTAGEGLIKSLTLEPCGGGGCSSGVLLIPTGLAWETLLQLTAGQIRDRIKAVDIEVKCIGFPFDEYAGQLTPELVNGSPSFLRFTTGTGALSNLAHANVRVAGSLTVEGPTGVTVLAEDP